MREILFRAKAINRDCGYHRTDYKNGDWVYGLITRPYNEMYEVPMQMANTDGVEGIEVDYKTLGQFTGLTDKNGKKIFEGDIVEANMLYSGIVNFFTKKEIVLVRYVEGCFYPLYDYVKREIEVIGNIHDNPELLEKK